MPTHWKQQLQYLIDLAKDRIKQMEAGEMSSGDIGPAARTVEAERAMIAQLQETIDRLNRAVPVQPRLAARR